MKIIEVSANKGGVGVTNVVCSVANILSETKNVLILDIADRPDTIAWYGAVMPKQDEMADAYNNDSLKIRTLNNGRNNSEIQIPSGDWDVVVVDAGTTGQKTYFSDSEKCETVERIAVVMNDYMSLKNIMYTELMESDIHICLFEENRPLTFNDIEHVMGKKCVRINKETSMARSIDAGLAPTRKALYEEWVNSMLATSVK